MNNRNNKHKIIILSLDIATYKTGFAILKNNKIIKSGTWHIAKNKDKYLYDLREKTISVIEKYYTDYDIQIVVESPYLDRQLERTFRLLCECHGVIQEIAQRYNLPKVIGYEPYEIKIGMGLPTKENGKLAGNRETQKADMIKIITGLGYQLERPKADDEADAIAVLIYHCECTNREIKHPKAV